MPTGNMPYPVEGECSAGIALTSRGNHGRPRTKPCKRLAVGDRKSGFSTKIPVGALVKSRVLSQQYQKAESDGTSFEGE